MIEAATQSVSCLSRKQTERHLLWCSLYKYTGQESKCMLFSCTWEIISDCWVTYWGCFVYLWSLAHTHMCFFSNCTKEMGTVFLSVLSVMHTWCQRSDKLCCCHHLITPCAVTHGFIFVTKFGVLMSEMARWNLQKVKIFLFANNRIMHCFNPVILTSNSSLLC